MDIEHIQSLTLREDLMLAMTPEVREEYEVFLENHLRFIRDFLPSGYENREHIHNTLLVIVDGKVIAFRYFFYDGEVCELFNTYVDSSHRKQSIATELFERSVSLSNEYGIHKFVVRMASENDERTGLFHKYQLLSTQKFSGSKFTIYYAGKEKVLG
ncbi:GNAT family N-acetyltransferase [Photobacterium sanguinicancri]|uniref:GNAT family N-acetyltransferase n=1 Tax=Photobacterium sanguinicancri TaxID=875932 RepID=UPI0024800F2C|nr:GNAT family N-acetyltransferase [Photobacterium sanguinicancri]